MAISITSKLVAVVARSKFTVPSIISFAHPPVIAAIVLFQGHSERRDSVYNILWAVVFAFATLNILSLAARRFEANRRGLTFGELMAVLIVLLSIFLLGWELLSVFHIFPIRLQR
jgi:hypothetical protein